MVIMVRENLYMKTLNTGNAEEVFAAIDANRKYLRQWLGWVDDTKSADDIQNVILSWEKEYQCGSDAVLGIFLDNKYVGNIGIHNISNTNHSAMIGYWLAEKYQGLGIMSDCVKKLINLCFEELNLNRVYIYCAEGNVKSRVIPKRLGFIEEGTMQEAEYLYGKYVNLVTYGIIKKNWPIQNITQKNRYINSAHLYDLDQRDNLYADIEFYKEYAASSNGNVLELACGTGRVSIQLASEGHKVTGLDLSNEMLSVFKQKLTNLEESTKNNISIFEQNMASFSFANKFNLIIAPFRAFQSLTTDDDITSCLLCVHKHLSTGGKFIINTFRPYKELDEDWCYPLRVQWERDDEISGDNIIKYHGGERIDTAKQIIYPYFCYKVTKPDGSIEKFYEKLQLKYYYYEQLKALLQENNFTVTEEFGWYDKTGINNGRELILVCTPNC